MAKRDLTLKCSTAQIHHQKKMTTLQIEFAAGMNRKNQEPISPSRTTPLCIAKLQSVHAHCPGFLQCRKDD